MLNIEWLDWTGEFQDRNVYPNAKLVLVSVHPCNSCSSPLGVEYVSLFRFATFGELYMQLWCDILRVFEIYAMWSDVSPGDERNPSISILRAVVWSIFDRPSQLAYIHPEPSFRQIGQFQKVLCFQWRRFLVSLFRVLRLPLGPPLRQDALEQHVRRFVVGLFANRPYLVRGEKAALAGSLEHSRLVAPQVGLRPLQRGDPRLQPRELRLDLGDDAALFGKGSERDSLLSQNTSADCGERRTGCLAFPIGLNVAQEVKQIQAGYLGERTHSRQPATDTRSFTTEVSRTNRGTNGNQDISCFSDLFRRRTPFHGRRIQIAKLSFALVERQANTICVVGAGRWRLPQDNLASFAHGRPRPPIRQRPHVACIVLCQIQLLTPSRRGAALLRPYLHLYTSPHSQPTQTSVGSPLSSNPVRRACPSQAGCPGLRPAHRERCGSGL
jgi:hypothetical protein